MIVTRMFGMQVRAMEEAGQSAPTVPLIERLTFRAEGHEVCALEQKLLGVPELPKIGGTRAPQQLP